MNNKSTQNTQANIVKYSFIEFSMSINIDMNNKSTQNTQVNIVKYSFVEFSVFHAILQ